MTKTNTSPRLFVDAALAPESALVLDAPQAHYLGQVMRLRAGDGVRLFNGRDGEWSAVIENLKKNRCLVTVNRLLRPHGAEFGPWLAFAPLKKTQTGFIVEKATELGASRLCPVITSRTNSARVNSDRMLARAIEASEQCERLSVPEIDAPETLERLMAEWPRGRRLLVLDETGAGQPIAQVLEDLRGGVGGISPDCGFLSGPEGGFEASELDALRKLDFVVGVGLGARVLRAETAAMSALACWQAILGEV
ncbi:MAG: 16S rRNA (uracil(1498)-N(3))-methyltransferase [Proteobacteria bacterium]|nr:16S rRNA (uracil(1498)-N(3))-methyltransferase [Pseudomonadota bacterium]